MIIKLMYKKAILLNTIFPTTHSDMFGEICSIHYNDLLMKRDKKNLSNTSLKEYIHRINLVLDYIDKHYDKELTLEELSSVASFSKYHFHRIFNALIGETLFQFIRRIRLEKACFFLSSQPDMSITEIAFKIGFSTSSSFTRSFTEYFAMPPNQWRNEFLQKSNPSIQDSNTGQEDSNPGKEKPMKSLYSILQFDLRRKDKKMEKQGRPVVIKDCPEKYVAYVRHIGPYKEDPALFAALSKKLCSWAGPRNLLNFPDTEFIIVYHDNPEITEENKLRISVCITIPKNTQVDGEIGKMTIPAGKYAFARFRLGSTGYQEAWDWLCGEWLPSSGYVPDDKPSYEQYYNGPEDNKDGMMDLDLVIPVKPL